MQGQQFTVEEVLSNGWRLAKAYFPFLIGYLGILFLLGIVFSGSHGGLRSSLFHLFGWVVVFIAKMGLYNSALLITKDIKPNFEQLYASWRHLISWVAASFLFGIAFFFGLVFFIVPGCYVLAKYGFYPFFILDKNMGPIEALQAAGKASEGRLWTLFLLFITCFAINAVGVLLIGVGLFFTIPITLLALATAYRKLTSPITLITEQSLGK